MIATERLKEIYNNFLKINGEINIKFFLNSLIKESIINDESYNL